MKASIPNMIAAKPRIAIAHQFRVSTSNIVVLLQ
jgi:hypothetical protein